MDDTDYVFGRSRAEYDRLIEQAELLRPLTERMLRAAGICQGMQVLDVGCGVGDVSFLVAELVGPKGSVVGVDLDPDALKVAEERRKTKRIMNLEFRKSDLRSVKSAQLFDAAVGRFILDLMKDPTETLRQIAERVRPGGLLAFHEADTRISLTPAMNLPVLGRLLDLLARTFECTGARLIGTELYSRMRDAGLEPDPNPLVEIAVCMGDGEVGYRRWSTFVRSVLPKVVEYGVATEKDMLEILDQRHAELVRTRGFVPLSWLMIAQWAHKPEIPVQAPQQK